MVRALLSHRSLAVWLMHLLCNDDLSAPKILLVSFSGAGSWKEVVAAGLGWLEEAWHGQPCRVVGCARAEQGSKRF